MNSPNRDALLRVARGLGALLDELVFVGGQVAELLITDPGATREGEHAVNLRTGGFAYAPGKHVHQFTCVGEPCSFFLHSDAPFDIHYVDQSGNEIAVEQALSKRHT